MSLDEVRREIERRVSGGGDVDVIVTTLGGRQTARAVRAGGGIVGIRSSESPPEGVPIGFVDWPFALDNPSMQSYIDMVEGLSPKYAVAPDVEEGRSLDETLAIAEELQQYADRVIVVPKDVPVSAVPEEYIVGIPFRNEWDQDTGVNAFADFRGRQVHILGGNPTEQLKLARRFDLDVVSVDSPNPLSWADFGRVWVARLGGANDVRDLIVSYVASGALDPDAVWEEFEAMDYENVDVDTLLSEVRIHIGEDAGFIGPEASAALDLPSMRGLLTSRYDRIRFTVRNLREAWNEGGAGDDCRGNRRSRAATASPARPRRRRARDGPWRVYDSGRADGAVASGDRRA